MFERLEGITEPRFGSFPLYSNAFFNHVLVENEHQAKNSNQNPSLQQPLSSNQAIELLLEQASELHEARKLREAVKVYDRAISLSNRSQQVDVIVVGCVKFNKALALQMLDEFGLAKHLYSEIISDYEHHSERFDSGIAASSLLNLGYLTRQRGVSEDTIHSVKATKSAIRIYNTLIAKFRAETRVDVAEPVAKAILNRSLLLEDLGELNAALSSYDDLINWMKIDARIPEQLLELISQTLYNKAIILVKQREFSSALNVLAFLSNSFLFCKSITIKQLSAQAHIERAAVYYLRGQKESSAFALDMFLMRYKENKTATIKRKYAYALLNKSLLLFSMNLIYYCIETLKHLVVSFRDEDGVFFKETVSEAILYTGISFKKVGMLIHANHVLDDLITNFAEVDTDKIRENIEYAKKELSEIRDLMKDKQTKAGLFEAAQGAADEATRPTAAHAQKRKNELPDFDWPTERFEHSPERGKKEGIIKFLRRVWRRAIEASMLSRPVLAEIDPSAEMALKNYLYNGGKRRQLPADLPIPTKSMLNDKQLAAGFVPASDVSRLASAARRRLAKAKKDESSYDPS